MPDRDHKPKQAPEATEAEIQRIIDENEAGLSDLFAAYEVAESAYFAAVVPQMSEILAGSTTSDS